MTFEQLDRSIDADSDSDDEIAEQAHLYKGTYTNILFFKQQSNTEFSLFR